MNSWRVLVSGASGPIGAALLPSLKARGYSVTCLVRGAATGPDHPPGRRIDCRPLDRSQEAAHPRQPHPGHAPSGGSGGQGGAAAGCVHLRFRGGLLRQSRRRDSARRQSVRRRIRRRGLSSVGGCRPARSCSRNSHRANAPWSGHERGWRRFEENAASVSPGSGRPPGRWPSVVELGIGRRRRGGNSACAGSRLSARPSQSSRADSGDERGIHENPGSRP